ncbi:NYN domain-containing protein [Nocardioides sp. zg-1308]|uniref:NYN domain-containing protein n=1 Tax=Nocardioides renjunii TaxID=3095075 RepID=A0ABU5K6S0_9ACTN|nr:NYN domain-containing protein [Nocardioides sp. S-58]MDZ5660596.1 NYN domain-containing protein [Nocardioides sp. S-58]NPD03712.1 NYN domain-containing protein [Nocardioides sp. zg-1308]
MDANTSTARIAVLIDADNTSHRYAEALLDEIAKYGDPTIKRAYGDWSSPRLGGWTTELNTRAIRGMHQGAFTRGKNSTDSALIIDAMDLLYAGNVEAFALVTSDSDFTSLALRLRESGKVVYGLGGARTPASLQNACNKFIRLESLGEPDAEPDAEPEPESEREAPEPEVREAAGTAPAVAEPDPVPEVNLPSALTKAVNAVAGDDGWAAPGAIGQHLSRTHPSLDPRNYGHRGLQGLLAAQPYLETSSDEAPMRVRVKGGATPTATPTRRRSTTKKAAAQQPTAQKAASTKAASTKAASKKTAGTTS